MTEGEEDSLNNCFSRLKIPKWFLRCIDRYPRSFAILFGIFLPLLFLDIISIFIGYWLSTIESPLEIVNNDEYLATVTRNQFVGDALANFTALTPKICFQSYMLGAEENIRFIDEFPEYANYSITDFIRALGVVQEIFNKVYDVDDTYVAENANKIVAVNVTEMYSYMKACGDRLQSEIEEVTRNVLSLPDQDASLKLTFNWNRCTPLRRPHGRKESTSFVESLRPENQSQYYMDIWEANRAALYEKYYEEYLAMNWNELEFNFDAWIAAVDEASGREACKVNSFAGAMFWFTVMTTIGYGNATLKTQEGRTMVFTLGFLSILVFGGILSTTGNVAIAIFDDLCFRFKLRRLTEPWHACFFWGLLYYAWMLVIAWVYKRWNANRLGEEGEVSYATSYWFAYISTTTVGFGDFYIAPETLLESDMFIWPALFLIGFVCLASFIEKFQEIRARHFARHGKNLVDRLARERPMPGSTDLENGREHTVFDNAVDSELIEECPYGHGNVSHTVDRIVGSGTAESLELNSPLHGESEAPNNC